MIEKLTQRSFLSPAVAFTFVPMAVTGLLMLFHLHFPGIKDIHDWVGLAFVVLSVVHICINWKPFAKYLTVGNAKMALAGALVLTVACGILGAANDDGQQGRHAQKHAAYGTLDK